MKSVCPSWAFRGAIVQGAKMNHQAFDTVERDMSNHHVTAVGFSLID